MQLTETTVIEDATSTKNEFPFLLNLLREIDNGNLRIPGFQRGFVWKETQIIELLRSIYKRYPIGSILVWETSDETFESKRDRTLPFPEPSGNFPATYVLDGVQRLSSLYGVLIDQGSKQSKFKVVFSLRNKYFRHIEKIDHKTKAVKKYPQKSHEVLLSDLFVPRLFINVQQKLEQENDSNDLIDSLFQIYDTFKQYQIPMTRITNRNPLEVFEIFEKINTQGTRLKQDQLPKAFRKPQKK
jgi:uncharacterized protein with ParB-like and HNH nuclease domain